VSLFSPNAAYIVLRTSFLRHRRQDGVAGVDVTAGLPDEIAVVQEASDDLVADADPRWKSGLAATTRSTSVPDQ